MYINYLLSTAAFYARVRGSVPGLGGLKETNHVSSQSTCESQYCGEPLWPRCSVLGLRPSGLEFRILCLEDSVISIISLSSGGLLAQFSLFVHKGGLKPDSFHLPFNLNFHLHQIRCIKRLLCSWNTSSSLVLCQLINQILFFRKSK